MAIPPIEIRWGGQGWPRGPKRRLGPVVSTALELATDGMEFMGFQPSEPKRATVWCVGDREPDAGQANGPQEFEIYIPYSFIKRPKKTGKLVVPLTLMSIHEATHCFREEMYTGDDLIERAASEGVSLWAERTLASKLLNPTEFANYAFHFSAQFPTETERTLLRAFLNDALLEAEFEAQGLEPSAADELHDFWFENSYGSGMPVGNQIGLIAVGRLIEVGATLQEVAAMPAHDIIGLDI